MAESRGVTKGQVSPGPVEPQQDPQEWENHAGEGNVAYDQATIKTVFDQLTPWPVPESDELSELYQPSG
jgi:hypothetical protein